MRSLTRAEVATAANALAPGDNARSRMLYERKPLLTFDSSRSDLLGWLQWEDSNGCWSDKASAAEGHPPLTLDEAWQVVGDNVFDEDVGVREGVEVSDV
jgi:hypothetical protein